MKQATLSSVGDAMARNLSIANETDDEADKLSVDKPEETQRRNVDAPIMHIEPPLR
jgi:hypothetical protein